MPSRRFCDRRQHLVAGPLVSRHPAAARRTTSCEAAAERGATVDGEAGQRPDVLRRVLPVAVDHHDDVEAVVDGVSVAQLLVAAIALVDGVDEDRPAVADAQVGERRASGHRGLIGRCVVDDEDVDVELVVEVGWHPPDDVSDVPFGLVRRDEDEQTGALAAACRSRIVEDIGRAA